MNTISENFIPDSISKYSIIFIYSVNQGNTILFKGSGNREELTYQKVNTIAKISMLFITQFQITLEDKV